MRKPGTTKVTIYKTATAETQRNNPKVIMLTGKSNKLITGFAIKEAIVKPKPVSSNVSNPFSKTKPITTEETKKMDTESITKCLNILFITTS